MLCLQLWHRPGQEGLKQPAPYRSGLAVPAHLVEQLWVEQRNMGAISYLPLQAHRRGRDDHGADTEMLPKHSCWGWAGPDPTLLVLP